MNKFLLFLFALLLAAACSTTRSLPENEQLYTGISKITYADDPSVLRRKGRDSVGVITAVANAVNKWSSVIEGKSTLQLDSLLTKNKKKLDQRRAKSH